MNDTAQEKSEVTIEISSYGSEGQGVGRLDGLAVFVPGTIVGEKVAVDITKKAPRYAEARILGVLEKSPNRVEPICQNYERCGGCDLMHMKYDHQLEFKRMKVENAFRRIGGFENISVQPCIGSPQTLRYRNKAVFSFTQMGGEVVSGTLAEKSHRVVETKECLLQSKTAICALEAVTEWANDFAVPAFDEKTGRGILRQLMVRSTSLFETMVVLIAAKRPQHESELVSRLIRAVPTVKSLELNLNPEPTLPNMGKKTVTLFGEEQVSERILGLDYFVAAQSFLQVNHDQTERLYSFAIDSLELSKKDNAVDLYCGIGAISLPMARRAGSVIGIEYVPQAIANANANAAANGITNAEFICGAAENVLPKLVRSGLSVSKLLLDPPRAGAMKSALDAIIECRPERIVYVSCDPATLARDCRMLCNSDKYMIECVQPFDMFPQTVHIETVTLLTRIK